MGCEAGTVTLEITIVIMLTIVCVLAGYGIIFKEIGVVMNMQNIVLTDSRDPIEFCDLLNMASGYSELLMEGIDVLIRDFSGGS